MDKKTSKQLKTNINSKIFQDGVRRGAFELDPTGLPTDIFLSADQVGVSSRLYIFDSMLKIFIMQSNREQSICDRMRKIFSTMTKFSMISLVGLCVFLQEMKIKTLNTYLQRSLDIVDHRNCRCIVVHTKESYVEGIRIILVFK